MMNRLRTPSAFQEAIFTFVEQGRGHGVVEATAGSGKTTTLVEAAHRLSSRTRSSSPLTFTRQPSSKPGCRNTSRYAPSTRSGPPPCVRTWGKASMKCASSRTKVARLSSTSSKTTRELGAYPRRRARRSPLPSESRPPDPARADWFERHPQFKGWQ